MQSPDLLLNITALDFVFFLTEKDWYVTITILSRGRVTM